MKLECALLLGVTAAWALGGPRDEELLLLLQPHREDATFRSARQLPRPQLRVSNLSANWRRRGPSAPETDAWDGSKLLRCTRATRRHKARVLVMWNL
jgi:hypothetical protein